MYEVKRPEAQSLLSELKAFAFEQSRSFRDGNLSGVEVARTFYCTDPVPRELSAYMEPDTCKIAFSLQAIRISGRGHKPYYTYELISSIERALNKLSEYQKQLIREEDLEDIDEEDLEDFDEVDFEETEFSEYNATTFEVSDHEPRIIDVTHKYAIICQDDAVFERTSDDVLYGVAGTLSAVPDMESDYAASQMFMPERITQERLSDADRTVTQLDFESIVNYEHMSDSFHNAVSHRDAAERMRYIMHVLRHGLDDWV